MTPKCVTLRKGFTKEMAIYFFSSSPLPKATFTTWTYNRIRIGAILKGKIQKVI